MNKRGFSINTLFYGFGIAFLVVTFVLCLYPDHLVFDEVFHIYDIHRYYSEPITISSLQEHYCPNGILSHILPGVFAKFLGSNDIVIIRLFVWLCVLGSFILLTIKRFSNDTLKLGFLITICNPYSFLCSTTFMTEFIALSFVILGLIIMQSKNSLKRNIGFFIIGLSIITRFYYIALIPAIFLPELMRINSLKVFKEVFRSNIFSFTLIIAPLIFLLFTWNSLTPPKLLEMGGELSEVGFNFPRFIISLIYLGFYVSPFIFFLPGIEWRKIIFNKSIVFPSILASIAILAIWPNIFNLVDRPISTGIIYSIYKLIISSFSENVGYAYNLTIISFCLISFFAFLYHFIERRLYSEKFGLIAGLFVLFFMIQQIFIGGNIAFYERYVFVASFFIGMLFVEQNSKLLSFKFLLALFLLFLVSLVNGLIIHT